MSGQPVKGPRDAENFRKAYLATLDVMIQNNEKNLQANLLHKRTGQISSQITDYRTPSEKFADATALKVDVRQQLRRICDVPNSERIVAQLGDDDIRFVAQHIEQIVKELQPKYRYGIDEPHFMAYLRKLQKVETEASGVPEDTVTARLSSFVTFEDIEASLLRPEAFDVLRDKVYDALDLTDADAKAFFKLCGAYIELYKEIENVAEEVRKRTISPIETNQAMKILRRVVVDLITPEDAHFFDAKLERAGDAQEVRQELSEFMYKMGSQADIESKEAEVHDLFIQLQNTGRPEDIRQRQQLAEEDELEKYGQRQRAGKKIASNLPKLLGKQKKKFVNQRIAELEAGETPESKEPSIFDPEYQARQAQLAKKRQAHRRSVARTNQRLEENEEERANISRVQALARGKQARKPLREAQEQKAQEQEKRERALEISRSIGRRAKALREEKAQTNIAKVVRGRQGRQEKQRKETERDLSKFSEKGRLLTKQALEEEEEEPVALTPTKAKAIAEKYAYELKKAGIPSPQEHLEQKKNAGIFPKSRKALDNAGYLADHGVALEKIQIQAKERRASGKGIASESGPSSLGGRTLSRVMHEPNAPPSRYNEGFGVRKISGRGLVEEKGVHKKVIFAPFGRHFINLVKLDSDILCFSRAKGTNIANLKTRRVSPDLACVIRKMVNGGTPSFNDLTKLSEEDKRMYADVLGKCHIPSGEGIDIPNQSSDGDMKKFEIMKGELLSGNDSTQLIKEFKVLIVKLIHQSRLPKAEGKELLMDLATLGY